MTIAREVIARVVAPVCLLAFVVLQRLLKSRPWHERAGLTLATPVPVLVAFPLHIQWEGMPEEKLSFGHHAVYYVMILALCLIAHAITRGMRNRGWALYLLTCITVTPLAWLLAAWVLAGVFGGS